MAKAKEFWRYLCDDLNYRIFSGVPCKGLKELYNKMDANVMHYIPAVNESVALGVVNGAYMSGIKGGILIDIDNFNVLLEWLSKFNIDYKVPALIIAFCKKDSTLFNRIKNLYRIPCVNLTENFNKDLKSITNKIEKLSIPGVLVVKKGVL